MKIHQLEQILENFSKCPHDSPFWFTVGGEAFFKLGGGGGQGIFQSGLRGGEPFFQGNILYIRENERNTLPITGIHFSLSNMNCHMNGPC